MRWLVGDIQGCAREFEQLLETIRFDPGRDELWCLGDLVNRGPDSLAVMRLWRSVGGRGVLGNHDIAALLCFSGVRPRKKMETLQNLFRTPDADELLAGLRALPILVSLPSTGTGLDSGCLCGGPLTAWCQDEDRIVQIPAGG